jgi:hypothetical protein
MPNVGSSGVVANDFISQVKEIHASKYLVRKSGMSKEVKEQVDKILRKFGFKTMDHAKFHKESYLGPKRNSGQRAAMVLENERLTLDQHEELAMFVKEWRDSFILPLEFCYKTTIDDVDLVGISNACTTNMVEHRELS